MTVHINSLMAYYANLRKFSRRENEILGVFVRNNNNPLTDRQIRAALDYADMNAVRPRVSELIKDDIMIECGNVICPYSKKQVRLVKIRERKEGQLSLDLGAA